MTVDKLREILSYYPADAEVVIKEYYGDVIKTDNIDIISKIKDNTITTVIIKANRKD